jgi:hypothetical protein
MTKRQKYPDYQKRFGVFITDENGIAVRCFNARKAAYGWLHKHYPELNQDEKSKRIWTFGSRSQVRRFWDKQIQLGCTNSEVLALMTYYCGVSTAHGFDLKNGRIKN